jgi:hypothetical protein
VASVALDTVHLALASDLAMQLLLDVPGIEDDDQGFGEVRTYAGGRRRSVSRTGNARTISLAPDWMARAEVAQLRTWLGRVVLYRDPTGRKVYGVFHALSSSPYIVNDMERVSFTLTEVTYSEAV